MERRRSSHNARLQRQVDAGRYVLLALTGLTLTNLILVAWKVEYRFLLSAAVPYYVNWLALKLGWGMGWTVFLGLLSVLAVAFYGGCWMLSRQQRFLTLALMAYGLDTFLLAIFAFTLLDNPSSCVLEIAVHLGVWYLMYMAQQAAGILRRYRKSGKKPQKERELV